MTRPKRARVVWFEPKITIYKPSGVPASALEFVILNREELEAVRIKDSLGLNQEISAKKMGISQPTFCRILSSARRKIANAIVDGKGIKIEGGIYEMWGARRGFGARGPPYLCKCPVCGHEQEKVRGLPCSKMRCKKCGAMVRRA